jgi:PHS family inorganic phosphate transporter-like MFS transporter
MSIHETDEETLQNALQEPLLVAPLSSDDNNNNEAEQEAESVETRDITAEASNQEPRPRPHQLLLLSLLPQLTAMISNFSTSYNVVNISMVLPIIEQLYPDTSSPEKSMVASSLLAGMIIGQILGGALGDSCLGRLGALKSVIVLQILASLASSYWVHGDDDDGDNNNNNNNLRFFRQLSLWRFLLGIGAGAVYPLAAVLSAESQTTTTRSPVSADTNTYYSQSNALDRVVWTFSMQGVGFLAVPLTTLVLLHSPLSLERIWRLLLALGALPGIAVMTLQCFEYRTPRPASFDESSISNPTLTGTQNVPTHVHSSNHNNSSYILLREDDSSIHAAAPTTAAHRDILEAVWSEEQLWAKLIGTAGTWFLFDFLFYGNSIFQSLVMEAAFGNKNDDNNGDENEQENSSDPRKVLQRIAYDSLILISMALPGYFVAALTLRGSDNDNDNIQSTRRQCQQQGPRYVMLQGLLCMSLLYLIMGIFWQQMIQSSAVLMFLYGLTFFFANYGPNTVTFVLPSIVYSPDCRSTLNGISAAAGKLGALVGAAGFAPMAAYYGDANVLLLCSILALIAWVITWYFVRP